MLSTSKDPARIITSVAVTIAILVALTLPLGYFLAVYRNLQTASDGQANLLSLRMSRLVFEQPRGWKFLSHLGELLRRELADFSSGRVAAILIEQDGGVIARTGPSPASPTLSVEAPLFDAGVQVAVIRVEHSLRPVLEETALAAVLGLFLAAAILVALRVLPLRALRHTLAELHGARNKAESHAHDLEISNETLQVKITERKQAEQALIDERIFTNTLIASLPDPFCVFESTGGFIRWNDKMRDVLGLSDTQMAATNALNTIYEADRLAVGQTIEQVFEQGAAITEARLVTKSGIRDFSLNATRADTAKGTYLVGVATDITERKRAEVARDQMVAILESTTDLVATSDPDGRILYMNGAGRSLLGVGIDEDITKTVIADFLPDPASHPILSEGIPAAVRQGSWSGETVLLSRRGPEIPVSQVILCHKAPDGKIETLSTIMRDITERKRADAELLQFATELDQRIFAAAAANDALQRQTEESQRLTVERAALAKMNDLLLACASSDEAFDIFGRAAPELFESSTGALHIYAASRNQLTPAATWGEWPDAVMPFSPEHCWGLRRGNYYLGNGTSTPPCEHAGSFKVGATLCVPLMAYGEVLGVLHLRGPDASTLQSRLQLVTLAGDGLAITLANIRLRQTLKEQAIRDPLTGLFNRRYLTETLVREFARAQRSGAPMAIVMIDVDHFKRFNDSFGHDAGDAVLQALGSFLSARFAPTISPVATAARSSAWCCRRWITTTRGSAPRPFAQEPRHSK